MSTATCAAEAEAAALMEALAEVDTTLLPWPEAPPERVMEVLRFLLEGSLTEAPRRGKATQVDTKNLAWCFLAGDNFRPVPVRTFETLEKKIAAGALYFTPNTFYNRRAKTANGLRWLNAIYVDFDDPELTLPDVLEAAAEAGLPSPTLVVKTPNGMHAYWKLKPVRATERAVRTYTALLRAVVSAVGGDLSAATAEHYMRIPRRVLYFIPYSYEMQDFLRWCRDWTGDNAQGAGGRRKGLITPRDLLTHPAVRTLFDGVGEGKRNSTAFTLALTLKASGYLYEDALGVLAAWNFQHNRPPLSLRELRRAIRSAYRDKYKGPSSRMLSYLSGVPFRYRVITHRPPTGRPRGRPSVHITAREKFLGLLESAGGVLITRESRATLARQIGVSPRTMSTVVVALVREGALLVQIRRLGKSRGAETTYILCRSAEAACGQSYNDAKNRNTKAGGGVAGGLALSNPDPPGRSLSPSPPSPVPRPRAPRRRAARRRTGPCPIPASAARPPPAQQF